VNPPRTITRAEREARKVAHGGLGDKLQTVIHAGIDASPLPEKAKTALKNCRGCGGRVAFINKAEKAVKKVKKFFGQEMQPPPAPPEV